ncbi:general amidase [Rhizopogon vinicolor AM-OR11-026]|uniref:General amidase n=1 Tax=Rhizopogon vinicolor AM-OR11-026 TaxID=1314800 RepID=A0A1B7MX05_9AGAM|nr:general amidase [Rhizopogon vinicolor AM-OR11-026]
MPKKQIQRIAEKKQRQIKFTPQKWLVSSPPDSTLDVIGFPETCGLLNAREIEVANTSVDVLLEKLACGKWTAMDVTASFYKRAIVSHRLVNCLTEIFIDNALTRAAELDDCLKNTGKVVGPLHALQISLKDQLCIEGLETTNAPSVSCVSWIGQYAEKNAVLVDILMECGAVPFVRTNWPESFNNIFGRTTNPYNRSLAPGGSSGGEGVLVFLKGGPLGIGSDLGGYGSYSEGTISSILTPSQQLYSYSLRICGLYGLRPSSSRVPCGGVVTPLEGQDYILPVFGPMTSSIGGVKAFMKAITRAKPWLEVPLTVRKKWNEDEYNLIDHGSGKDLCFAIMWDNGVVVPHPPIRRSMQVTKAALEKAGYKVVDWKPIKHRWDIWSAGSAEEIMITTSVTGELIIATMELENSDAADSITAYQLWQLQKMRRDLRKEYLDHWEATASETGTGRPVDATICPAAPFVATPRGKNSIQAMSKYINYTAVWNVLDYPATIFPVTTVDPNLDAKKSPHYFYDGFNKGIYEMYDPETFKNAPVCLQLVGRTLKDEAVVKMTEIVNAALAAAK